MLSGSAEHLQVFVQISSCALKSPLLLAGLTSYSEVFLLTSNSSLALECLERKGGQSSSSFYLLEAKVRNGTEHGPGG